MSFSSCPHSRQDIARRDCSDPSLTPGTSQEIQDSETLRIQRITAVAMSLVCAMPQCLIDRLKKGGKMKMCQVLQDAYRICELYKQGEQAAHILAFKDQYILLN